MLCVFRARVVLHNRVAPNASLRTRADSRLVVLFTVVHYDIRLVADVVDTNLAQTHVVALNFGSRALAALDARTFDVGNLEAKDQLASTFSLYEDTDNDTVLNSAVLNDHLVVRLRTSEDSPRSEVHERTIADV